jgi:hypothetical protein
LEKLKPTTPSWKWRLYRKSTFPCPRRRLWIVLPADSTPAVAAVAMTLIRRDGAVDEAPVLEGIPQVVTAVDVHDDDVGGLRQTEALQDLHVLVRTDPAQPEAVGRAIENIGEPIRPDVLGGDGQAPGEGVAQRDDVDALGPVASVRQRVAEAVRVQAHQIECLRIAIADLDLGERLEDLQGRTAVVAIQLPDLGPVRQLAPLRDVERHLLLKTKQQIERNQLRPDAKSDLHQSERERGGEQHVDRHEDDAPDPQVPSHRQFPRATARVG